MLQNKIKDKFNGIHVSNFHNRSTEPLSYRIYTRPQSIKQARRPEFYKYTRLPVTRYVKLSLNFELLVNTVMKFLFILIKILFYSEPYPRNNHASEVFD